MTKFCKLIDTQLLMLCNEKSMQEKDCLGWISFAFSVDYYVV